MSKRKYESYKPEYEPGPALHRNATWHRSDHLPTTSNDFVPRDNARLARDERDEPDWRHQKISDPRHRRSSYHVPSDAHKASVASYDGFSSPSASGEREFLDCGNNHECSRLPNHGLIAESDGRSLSDRRVPHPLDTRSDIVMTSPAGSPSSATHRSAKVNGLKSGRSTPKTGVSKIVEPSESANNADLKARLTDLVDNAADLAMRRIHHDMAQRNFDKRMEEQSRWDKYRDSKNYVAIDEDLTRRVQKTEQARDHTAKLLSQSEERNVNAVESLDSYLSATYNRASSQKSAEESALKPMWGQSVDVKEDDPTLKKLIARLVLEQTEKMQTSCESYQQQIDLLKANKISEARFKDFDTRLSSLSDKMQTPCETYEQQLDLLKAKTISEARFKNFDTRLSFLSDSQTKSEALSVRYESTISGLQKSISDSKALETILKQDLSATNAEVARLQNRCDMQQNLLEELGHDARLRKEDGETAIASVTELKETLDKSCEKHERSIESLHQVSVNKQTRVDQLQQQYQDLLSSVSSIEREIKGPSDQLGDNGIAGFVQELENQNTSLIEALEGRDTQLNFLGSSVDSLKSSLCALEEQLRSQSLASQVMSPGIPSSPRFWQRQDTPPISLSSRLKQSPDVPDPPNLQSINERFDCVFKKISGMKENESKRDEVVSAAVESVQNDSIKQQATVDRLSTDVSVLKTENEELRAEIESEKETRKSLESAYNAQATTVKAIQNGLLSLGALRPDLSELQSKVSQNGNRLEAKMKDFAASVDDRVGPLEDFSTKMDARFDNLTTDHLARNIVHQMQQMYPPHPGNIYQEITLLKEKQERQAYHTSQAFGMGQRALDESTKTLELRKIVSDLQQKVDMPPPNPIDSRAVKDSGENQNRNSVAIEVCRSQCQEMKRQIDRLTSDQAPVRSLTTRVEGISKNLEQLNPKEYQEKLETIRKESNSSLDRVKTEFSEHRAECLAHQNKMQVSLNAIESKVGSLGKDFDQMKVEVSKRRAECLGHRNETQAPPDTTQSKMAILEKNLKQLSQTVNYDHQNLVTEISRVENENKALKEKVSHMEHCATQDSILGNPFRNDEIDEDSDVPIKRLKRSQPSSQTMEERKISKKRRYEDDEDHSEGSDIALRHTRQSARMRSHEVTNSPSTRSKGWLRAPSTDTIIIDGRS
ncbi:MAG: hypothetical protein Q9214_003685 [Letrouitia sp. 1 TL-2023]